MARPDIAFRASGGILPCASSQIWGVLVLGCLAGCGAPEGPSTVEVRLSSAFGCQLAAIDEARIEAWGDFPLRDEHVELTSGETRVRMDGLPQATQAVFVALSGGGGVVRGVVGVPPGLDRAAVLLLPMDVSCPVPDPEVRATDGSTIVALADGTLLFVGGLDERDFATRRLLTFGPADELASTPPAALFNAAAHASVTPTDARAVLVAGGIGSRTDRPSDTFERVELDDPPGAPRRVGTLAVARSHHAAVLLDDGSVLLIGGRDGASVLDSIERIAPDADRGVAVLARLGRRRASPTAVALLDRRIVVAGGVDERGPVQTIDVLDADQRDVTSYDLGLPPPRAVAVLPGPRLLWVGTNGRAWHVLFDGAPSAIDIGVSLPDGPLAASLRGEVIVHDVGAMRPELVVLSSGGTITRGITSRRAEVLVAVDDGTFVELDATGASRFRRATLSPFAAPPSSFQFPFDVGEVILDSPSRFEAAMGMAGLNVLRATAEGATLLVPPYRMRDLRVTLRMAGAGALLFTSAGGVEGQVTIDADALSIGPCRADRTPGSEIVVERVSGRILIAAGGASSSCELSLPERVGIGLRLSAGAELSSIALERVAVP